jgi:hypothetical protein
MTFIARAAAAASAKVNILFAIIYTKVQDRS